ncbi:MAG: bacillithiol biosynthesis BshC [Candidatus Eisenbacteria bacterium]|nr:bacillithiol biosynthesis BshC [Candidatus Eisenbacteria bacterium]
MTLTRTLSVRARVPMRAGSGPERFVDPLLDDLARRGPLSRERFSTHWGDPAALAALADRKRGPLAAPLLEELTAYHRRLGASPCSLAALDRLGRGEVVCVVAGQQPAPLGGPLYSLHKIAATVGMAADFTARTGAACVPLFWMHGEDSDFAEIRTVTVGDAALSLHDLELPALAHRDGGLVGSIARDPVAGIERRAIDAWSALPGGPQLDALLARIGGVARDLGETISALMLELFAEQGLVVVDPRLPAFRAAARVVIDRYLARADSLSEAARHAGAWLEPRIGRRPLADASLESFVFAIEDGKRRKIPLDEARSAGASRTLAPSVALRSAVQDGVLPTVAMACGPGEVAYLLQLREVFKGVGVEPACPVPRLAVTWLPPAAVSLIEQSGEDAATLISGADAAISRLAALAVPAAAREALAEAHRAALEGLARVSETARAVDSSLPQMVESARAKIDFQYQRLSEGLAGKVQKKLERLHPEWPRLRYYLRPGDRWQERRLASLEPAAYRGLAVAAETCELARDHAERVARGELDHIVADL